MAVAADDGTTGVSPEPPAVQSQETRRRSGQEVMVSHVVLMKPRADLTADQREQFAAAFERAIAEIASVRRVRVGRRLRHGAGYEAGMPDAADVLVSIEFDDRPGLEAYLRHPAHEELAARFGESLSSALIYDFEVGGIEALSWFA
jgi:hypothetical protein